MRLRDYKGYNTSGTGETINGVTIEYSCGAEGYKEITQSYGKRRKGYGKPKHTWKALFRVFSYLKGDKWMFFAAIFATVATILVNLVGGFVNAPIVDGLLNPAVMAMRGDWGQYGSYLGYESAVISTSPFNKILFSMMDWGLPSSEIFSEAIGILLSVIGVLVGLYLIGFLCSVAQIFLMTTPSSRDCLYPISTRPPTATSCRGLPTTSTTSPSSSTPASSSFSPRW